MNKEYSREFQSDLLDLFKMCYENHTDNCTLTFEYPKSKAIFEIDFTFRVKKKE